MVYSSTVKFFNVTECSVVHAFLFLNFSESYQSFVLNCVSSVFSTLAKYLHC